MNVWCITVAKNCRLDLLRHVEAEEMFELLAKGMLNGGV